MTVRRRLIFLHRWLGLAAGLLWLVQAITGTLIVFHWEIADAQIAAPQRATDFTALGRRLEQLAPAGSGRTIGSVWTSAGAADRWDVAIDDPRRGGISVRLDGAGDVLRMRPDGARFADGAWIDTLVAIHQQLLGGALGSWIVGISGLLLLSNLLLGLYAAWPRAGQWRRALTPPNAGGKAARAYGWHRALGLWAIAPAIVMVTTGILGVFADGFAGIIGVEQPAPIAAQPRTALDRPFAEIVRIALARHPGARLSGVNMPGPDDTVFDVRLMLPGEPRRAYGKSTVLVRRDTGEVVADRDARAAPLPERIVDLVFPIHTGEIAGMPGRLAAAAVGLWLATMILLGATLWWRRRRPAR